MAHRCPTCGKKVEWPPMCFGAEAPWRELGITEQEFEARVELTKDQCVIDGKHFFVRGHVEIPVHSLSGPFAWSVWCSLSEANFRSMADRWDTPGRELDPPMFGWLQTSVPCYPETVPTKTRVHTRPIGLVPLIEVDPAHPLGQEQLTGISVDRIREIARAVLGADFAQRCDSCRNATDGI